MDHSITILSEKEKAILESYMLSADGLAEFWGENCEVIIHDLTQLDASVVKIVNGHIPSTKKEPAHGYGLLNVRDILTQLHAEYSIRYEAGWFRFTAEIPKE